MSSRRSILAISLLFSVLFTPGCNYQGEEPEKQKDFAVNTQVTTAIGAAGSTFVNPLMTHWINKYSEAHPTIQINYQPIGS
jgi:ABC-type phosphate transport system substrate-binding protein